MNIDLHPGFARVFQPRRLTLGLFFPIEAYAGDTPQMVGQEALAARAEALGFSALWFRDVPLRDRSFGDVGQIYDPWVYLAHIGAHTRQVALVTGAIVLTLRHPLHVAKAAASVDALTGGRLVMGVASGDREREFESFGVAHQSRGEIFREHFTLIRRALSEPSPEWESRSGRLNGLDPIPKPALGGVPMMVTGASQQDVDWIARNADAWATYPRPPRVQADITARFRAAVEAAGVDRERPVAQSLYIDLHAVARAAPRPIHLGWSLGRDALVDLLGGLHEAGIAHVVLNLKYGRRPAPEVLEELGAEVVPRLPGALIEPVAETKSA